MMVGSKGCLWVTFLTRPFPSSPAISAAFID